MFEDRSLKLDLCALALVALRRVPRRRAVDVRSDRSAEHARLAAERDRSQRLRPGRRYHRPLLVRKPRHWRVLPGRLARGAHVAAVGAARDRSADAAHGRLGDFGRRPHDAGRAGGAELDAGPVVGAGGYVGAMGRGFLETHFAQAGAFIFALSVLLAGLLLSTDYFLFRAAAVTTSVTGRSLMQVGHLGHVGRKKLAA